MAGTQKTTNAVEILHNRYIGDNTKRKQSLQAERLNAKVARMIYNIRQEVKMTQKELADTIGTTQSVISRLEDADYSGHSLSMLDKIAKALNRELTIKMTSKSKNRTRQNTKDCEEYLIESLKDSKKAIAYLNAAMENPESPENFITALRDVSHAWGGPEKLAEKTGLDKRSLNRVLFKSKNPTWSSIAKILHALNIKFTTAKA